MMRNKKAILIFCILLFFISSFLLVKKSDPSIFNWQDKQGDEANTQDLADAYESELDIDTSSKDGEPRELSFLFFGDIMLDRHVREILKSTTVSDLLSPLLQTGEEYFAHKDIISANLEGAVTNEGAHYSPVNLYDFAFIPEHVLALNELGFNYFALANNHFADQGQRGMDETRENLRAMDLYFSGSADAVVNEFSRTNIDVCEQSVAMISLSMVYNHFNREEAVALVRLASEESDLVLLNIHWGNEYQHHFNKYQQEVAHYLIDAGVDIIIGHHPHVVQGMEIYDGKPIFYSLGNFIFDQYFSAETQEGLALDLRVGDEELELNFLPHRSFRSSPRFMDESEKADFLLKYANWSKLSSELKEQLGEGKIIISR